MNSSPAESFRRSNPDLFNKPAPDHKPAGAAKAVATRIGELLTVLDNMPVQDRFPMLQNVTDHAVRLLHRAEDELREKED